MAERMTWMVNPPSVWDLQSLSDSEYLEVLEVGFVVADYAPADIDADTDRR